MIRYRSLDRQLSRDHVLRRWVGRETPKDGYPDADPADWDTERLVRELEETYDEPAAPALRGSPAWVAVTLDASELAAFDAFPACGWDALSEDGTIGDAVTRLESASVRAEFPNAAEQIAEFGALYRDQGRDDDLGALVARQFDDDWPPVLLEGNHRACAAVRAAREGARVEVTVHLGCEDPLENLPLGPR